MADLDPAAGATPAATDPAVAAAAAPAAPAPTANEPAGAAAPAAGQAPGAGAEPSPVYRPEGLPDHLLGANERETIDKLFKAYGGARQVIGTQGVVPETPEAYAFTPSEAVAPYLPNADKDPVLAQFKGVAHKHGVGDKQFAGILNDMFEGLIGGGMLDDPYSPDKERAIIAPGLAGEEQKTAAERARNDAIAYVDAMVAQKTLAPETADFFKGRSDRGHMIALVNAFRAQSAPGLAMGGNGPSAGDSMGELDKRIADPRNAFGTPTYSEAFAKETTALAKRLIGDGAPDRV